MYTPPISRKKKDGLPRYLYHDKSGYYVRMIVPEMLRPIVGQNELTRRLGATSDANARRKLHAVVAEFTATIDSARAQAKAMNIQPAPHYGHPLLPRQLAEQQYRDRLRFDLECRKASPAYAAFGFPDEDYVEALRQIVRYAATDEQMRDTLGVVARYYENRGNVPGPIGTDQWREAMRALAVAELESLTRTVERDEGDFNGQPSDPLLTAQPEPVSDKFSARCLGPDSHKSLSELLPDFLKERKPSPRAAGDYAVTLRVFAEAIGEEKPVYRVTRSDIVTFKNTLLELPANYTKRFPGKAVSEAIKANKARKVPFEPLNNVTINNKYLTDMRSMLGWCVSNEIIPDNPASDIKVLEAGSGRKPDPMPFSPGDLTKIFSAERFKGSQFDETQWALLVSLFTGTRASETAQIKLDSIRTERDVLVFVIEERTKNRTSKRLIPVHSTLIKFGLEKRIDGLRRAGETHLFPDWYRQGAVKGNFEKYIPERFRVTTKKNLGIEGRKSWHSFRRNFASALNFAGVDDAANRALMGHKDGTPHAVYIHGHAVEVMKIAIEKLRFDGFTLV